MTHRARVSVVTDAVSPDFYFPLWHKYYGTFFGTRNLHVICFGDDGVSFSEWALGSIEHAPVFNNAERARYVSHKVNRLLEVSDIVIRCDVDEFLVPNPKLYNDLRHYIEELKTGHVTSFGYDVLQAANEAGLDLEMPILGAQRRFAYAVDSLCKTSIVSSATHWGGGFHASSKPPLFNELYMFHLKLADLDLQMQIGTSVARHADEKKFHEYHSRTKDVFLTQARQYFSRPPVAGFDAFAMKAFFEDYLHRTKFGNGMYYTEEFKHDRTLLEIPGEFYGKL
jgi:hypothetical protein